MKCRRKAERPPFSSGRLQALLLDWSRNRHCKQMMKIQLVRLLVGPYADAYSALIHIGQKRTKPPVPGRKNRTVIGVALLQNDRVVNPVHGWGDKEHPEHRLKPLGHPQAAMMELGEQDKNTFKDQYAQETRTQKKDEGYLNNGGNG